MAKRRAPKVASAGLTVCPKCGAGRLVPGHGADGHPTVFANLWAGREVTVPLSDWSCGCQACGHRWTQPGAEGLTQCHTPKP